MPTKFHPRSELKAVSPNRVGKELAMLVTEVARSILSINTSAARGTPHSNLLMWCWDCWWTGASCLSRCRGGVGWKQSPIHHRKECSLRHMCGMCNAWFQLLCNRSWHGWKAWLRHPNMPATQTAVHLCLLATSNKQVTGAPAAQTKFDESQIV